MDSVGIVGPAYNRSDFRGRHWRPRLRGVAFLSLSLLAGQAAWSQVVAHSASASSAFYTADLVPAPDLRTITGTLELRTIWSPFGVAVTVDGRPRYRLVAHIAGLPAPRILGRYATYVAWAYTIAMDSAVKLGPVANGVTVLGELGYDQFRVVITAESSDRVAARGGRIVLRGTSPSARLLAHRDLVQPVAPGAMGIDRGPVAATGAPMHEHGAAGGGSVWTMPTMAASMAMMPGMSALVPSVGPMLPRAPSDSAIPDARPGTMVRLRDGDTLDLEARIVGRSIGGKRLVMYGFNGQYPGPLLRVRKGATAIVRFRNQIDQPSAIHWHGVRLDNTSDGVPDITQRAVPPGGEFVYRVHFPDAGAYWYHPHVREDVQQSLGLYGTILVNAAGVNYYGTSVREEVLALGDILLDDRGIAPYGDTSPTHALMGRWGNVFLINGEPSYRLAVRQGEVVRFFLTNVSTARVYNVSFGGVGAARIKVVGTDGGKLEREEWVSSVVLAPAERAVVDVRFDRPGEAPLLNRVQALNHMYGTYAPETDTLGQLLVESRSGPGPRSSPAFSRLRRNDDVARALAPYRRYFGRPVDRTLVLGLRVRDAPRPVALMLNGLNAPMDWNDGMTMANWVMTGREVTWILRDAVTGRENMDVAWRFKAGDVIKLRLFNDPSAIHAMDHPIHIHGQRFLVLSRNGVSNPNLAWKDTAIIQVGETVDLLVDLSNPGRWLLHCHIAEHMGTGMMITFDVN